MATSVWTVSGPEAGTRLDKWLAHESRLGSRRRALEALERGKVFVEDLEQGGADAGRRLAAGTAVGVWLDRPGSAARRGARRIHGLDVVFEDDALIVLDKPAGVLTVPRPDRPEEPSLAAQVAVHWRSHQVPDPLVVHRIDRDTTGLVVFARTPEVWADLKQQFAARLPERRYLTVVLGTPLPPEGTWQDALLWDEERRCQHRALPGVEGAREALSRYRTVERLGAASLLAVDLVTGRRHQVRAQAMLHGHPLLGERIYVAGLGARGTAAFARQALHASRLSFRHPVSGRTVTFEAPLPDDLRRLLAELRKGAADETPRDPEPAPGDA